ncbi:MAG: hypothetical protein LC107_10435 [Chitinophagales bacterium]|nr:hypothetical protein [Chitinophagales bacterium]
MTIDLKALFDLSDDQGLNDKVIRELLVSIKDNQVEPFDYLKFKLSYKNLESLGMDNETAIKSAMLTAKTIGLTKEKLLQNVGHYKGVLNREREKFAVALKNQIALQVDKKQEDIQTYKDKIEGNQRKIQQLMEEQRVLEQRILETESSLKASKEKIEEIKDQFNGSFNALYKHIEEDSRLFDNIL